MTGGARPLAGLRILLAGRDASLDALIGEIDALGARAEAATRIHDVLDLLEAADPPFSAVLVANHLDDADGAALARAIRGSPVLGGLRVAALADGRIAREVDVVLQGTDAAALITAIVEPVPMPRDAEPAPVLDLEELASIAGGLSEDLRAILDRFAGQALDLARSATAAAAAKETAAAERSAHSLKGAALSAGAIRLGQAAAAFERAAAVDDWPTAAEIDLIGEAEVLAYAIAAALTPR
jgi:HPt (histidine-containing phosphotransfer) domain-containing protein